MTRAAPTAGSVFSPGSVSLRLYPHNELRPSEVVAQLCGQAALAETAGFAGIMLSEHHGGFPGYLPNPLQTAGFILEDCPHLWAAACPILLPLRPTALVAEEVAWLAARHPGRVGLGVAAGSLPSDFEVMGVPASTSATSFKAGLPRIVDLLRGRGLGPLGQDPALRAGAAAPVPVLSAAMSPAAARRAARCGAGILMEGMSAPRSLARLTAAYHEAGGSATTVLVRRVWLGDLPSELVDRQRKVYDTYAARGPATFGEDQTVTATDPARLARLLEVAARESGADALNLRVHLPGASPPAVRDQIARLGREVLPLLRLQPPVPPA